MKKNNWKHKLLCLSLIACMLLPLAACQGPETPAPCVHSGGTATCKDKAICEKCGEAYGSTAAHQYENGTCTVCGAAEGGGEDDGGHQPTPDHDADGAPVSGGGATIPEGSFALTETVYDESKAEETKSNTFFRTAVRGPGKVFRISDGKALTIGFKKQSCGQVYVLEKLGSGQVRVVTGAGMMNEFGNTNKAYYDTKGMGAQRMGTFYAYCDTSFKRILSKNNTVDGVDTMIMEVSDSVCRVWLPAAFYGRKPAVFSI